MKTFNDFSYTLVLQNDNKTIKIVKTMNEKIKQQGSINKGIEYEPLLCTINFNPKQLYDYVKPLYEYYFKKYNGEEEFKKLSLTYVRGYVTINNGGFITKCRAIQFERYMLNLKSYCA